VIELGRIGARSPDSFASSRCAQFDRAGIVERAHIARHWRASTLQDNGIRYKHFTSSLWSNVFMT
jgi:hypothetical protein